MGNLKTHHIFSRGEIWTIHPCIYVPVLPSIIMNTSRIVFSGPIYVLESRKRLVGMIYIRESSCPFQGFISPGISLARSHMHTAIHSSVQPHSLTKNTPQLTLASGVKRSGWQPARKVESVFFWMIYIRESSSPFQGFIPVWEFPELAVTYVHSLFSPVSLSHQEYPQANPGIRGEAALAGKQPMSNKVAKYVKG